MKFCLKTFLAFFLLLHTQFFCEEGGEPLQEYDDDAFLSEGESAQQSTGLIGWSLFRSEGDDEDRYIINFNNVSIVEYIRFVSKISNLNFLFEEGDLDFATTVISEEPLTVQNIVSALIQTLRARGFSILVQDSNLMITRSREINQIPTIVTQKDRDKSGDNAPIITRVFRIQNANLNSLSEIIRPMMSQGAMVDVSNETRQLIVTDITTNVDKVATLLQSLDSPHSPLEIDSYKARHLSVVSLTAMTDLIITPFKDGSPLTFVPQVETNSIFIVSTPQLIERAVEIMEDLDIAPSASTTGPIGDEVFLYKPKNKPGREILKGLRSIADELDDTGSQAIKLIATIENAKWVPDSNSLLFITDKSTQPKLEEILKSLDTISEVRNYYIYKIGKAEKDQIEGSLEQLAKSLSRSASDKDLVEAIHSMRYIKETNSIIFTGTEDSLGKLKELLPTFDVDVTEYSPSSHYWLYTPKYLNGKELERSIEELEDSLSTSGYANDAFLEAIDSMQWVPATNTLLFSGSPNAIAHIQSIIKLIDVPSSAPSKIFLYQPKHLSNEQIEEALDELADKLDHKNLADRNLAGAIDDMTWISESQTFLFKADPASIESIAAFLKEIDERKEVKEISQGYYLYNLESVQGEEVIEQLKTISKSLTTDDPTQKATTVVIEDLTYLPESNSILLTGQQQAIENVKELISQFDKVGPAPSSHVKSAFFIYAPRHISPEELEDALKETASDLKSSGLVDPNLLQSIETMRIVDATGSVIFTGTKESLEKTEEIIATIDTPAATKDVAEATRTAQERATAEVEGANFFIYRVLYIPVKDLINLLDNFAGSLEKERSKSNLSLIKAIKSAKEIKESNSILFTGSPKTLERVAQIVKQFDVPEGMEAKPGEVVREAGTYLIYKPAHVSGPELIDMMGDFEKNLAASGVRDPNLYEAIDNMKYIKRTGYILISGEKAAVNKVDELLRNFDVPSQATEAGVTSLAQMKTSFLIYKLHYNSGKSIQETLREVGNELSIASPQEDKPLADAIKSIQWIKATNSLLATGSPDVLTQLKELIQNVDVPLRQVFIEVLIIQTTITNSQQFGLQWGGKVQYLSRFAGGTSNFPSPNPAASPSTNHSLAPGLAAVNGSRTPLATDIPNPSTPTGGFDLGVIGDIILHKGKSFLSLGSLLTAIQQDNDSVVVMNPKIIAQDNQQSTIFVGQNIPFVGSSIATTSGAGTQTAANIEYRDVGTSLSITPTLGTNEIVTLQISNEITEQVANTAATIDSVQGLQTARTSINTRVHVPNRHFVAFSGMLSDTKTHFKSSIPCLGGLPVIGAIFSENDRLNSRDNIIFFIRPVIIDSIEEYQEITENQECLFKDLGSKQIVKEEIDAGIDWVKTPENEY
ncbi:MAG: Type II secretion system protein D [Chlamydiae bacterium]|nr:Type II secretion system protein D [Chlamydiota bacterium]